MGKSVLVSTKEIKPSQDFLKEKTVKFILRCLKNNQPNLLPPQPIVRRGDNGELIAVDGHNLVAVYDWLGEDVSIFVVDDKNDNLQNYGSGVELRRKDFQEKFQKVTLWREQLKKQGINSFSDLWKKYNFLFQRYERQEVKKGLFKLR